MINLGVQQGYMALLLHFVLKEKIYFLINILAGLHQGGEGLTGFIDVLN